MDDSSNQARVFPGRELSLVALRIMGLWFIFGGVSLVPMVVSQLFWAPPGSMTGGEQLRLWLAGTMSFGVRIVVGVLILVYSGWIAAKLYPQPVTGSSDLSFGKVGAGDLFRIASFVLGIYAMLLAVTPAVRLAGELVEWGPRGDGFVVHDAVHAGVYLASGLLLAFGARPIAQWMASLRYDADTIPRQQISLLFLMGVVLVVAVVLGLMRSFFR